VREWCEDWIDPAKKDHRVLRGGSWRGYIRGILWSSNRGSATGRRSNGNGFRCVLMESSGS